MRKTAFIGHRRICQNNLAEKLNLTIERQIHSGCIHFIVGRTENLIVLLCPLAVHYENNTRSWSLKS